MNVITAGILDRISKKATQYVKRKSLIITLGVLIKKALKTIEELEVNSGKVNKKVLIEIAKLKKPLVKTDTIFNSKLGKQGKIAKGIQEGLHGDKL